LFQLFQLSTFQLLSSFELFAASVYNIAILSRKKEDSGCPLGVEGNEFPSTRGGGYRTYSATHPWAPTRGGSSVAGNSFPVSSSPEFIPVSSSPEFIPGIQ
ncbi:MAG: hypothetical protein PHT79_03905, partial [Syntrophomonadaceae bacterium]|nr:hypothetical protein [Syntrophomonadaceae bacterium]